MPSPSRPRFPDLPSALVVGATSHIGEHVIGDLLARGFDVTASKVRLWEPNYPDTRRLTVEQLHFFHMRPDEIRGWMKPFNIVIVIPPVSITHLILPFLKEAGVKKLVVISSHNASLFPDTPGYRKLIEGENHIIHSGLNYVIVRPTMIIGHENDNNASRLMTLAKQRDFLPLLGRGQALQQPIDYLDLADALVYAALKPKIRKQIVSVSGPEILTLKEFYRRIMRHVGLHPRLLPLPVMPIKWGAKTLETLRIPTPVRYAQINRSQFNKDVGELKLPGWQPKHRLDDTLARLAKNMFPPLDPDAGTS